MAYIGELGLGALRDLRAGHQRRRASSRSRRSTSLTSLTRAPPGRAGRGAPERYYPTGRRTFLRLVPNDLREVELLTAASGRWARARVALVAGEGVYAEELVSQLAERLRRAGHTLIADRRPDRRPRRGARAGAPTSWRSDPDAIVYAGLGDRPAERAPRGARRGALPATPVLAAAGIARPRAGALRPGAGASRGLQPAPAGCRATAARRSACSRQCGAATGRGRGPARGALRLRGRARWCSTRWPRREPGAPAVVRAALRRGPARTAGRALRGQPVGRRDRRRR